jgi:ribosome-associated protein
MTHWPQEEVLAARASALAIAAKAREEKAADPLVLDVSGSSDLFTHLVILTATSSRHARALADTVLALAKERGLYRLGVEGAAEGRWILVDLTDVVVHVFLPEVREFYNLEIHWADAERVVGEEAPAAAPEGTGAKEEAAPKPRRRRRTGSVPKED